MLDLRYHADKVRVLNASGTVGILTLWSRVDTALKKLGELPGNVAAISNFYGDGISQLLANLLANPQIRVIHISGADRSGSLADLLSFFSNGVEEVNIHGIKQNRIIGTNRLVNPVITGPGMFQGDPPAIITHSDFDTMRVALSADLVYRPVGRHPIHLNLIEEQPDAFPSNQFAHQILADNIVDAWLELLFVIHRFGEPVRLAKGNRRELYNLKVVIKEPRWLDDDTYNRANLNVERLHSYSPMLLDGILPEDTSYTYGHRLRSYFGFDAVERVINRLEFDNNDRKSYISLWDERTDFEWPDSGASNPCWVGAYFRLIGNKLCLSCTFRTHRAYTAWVENAHSLMDLMVYVASKLGDRFGRAVGIGSLTIMSHSVGIDPAHMSEVEGLIAGRRWRMRDDGRGDLVFSVSDGKIVVEHKSNGVLLKRYIHHNAEVLSHQLAQDHVVSDLSHALYVGRQLGKLQLCLKENIEYTES